MSRMTVSQLMKRATTVALPHQTLVAARDEMRRAGVHHLPIVAADGKLLGLLSQRDLDRALDLMSAAEGLRQPLIIADILKGPGLRAPPELPADQAAANLIETHADGLLVVDRAGHLLGILTTTDFLEVAREALLGLDPEVRARA